MFVPNHFLCKEEQEQEEARFAIVEDVLLHKGFWDLLWYVCKALLMYRLLRLADMKIGGIEKVKYFMHQINQPYHNQLMRLWKSGTVIAVQL